jgi:hypothetical protein
MRDDPSRRASSRESSRRDRNLQGEDRLAQAGRLALVARDEGNASHKEQI